MNSLIEQYKTLNNSFRKTLVFHVGASAGFFSEYNCMILAMLYCLKNKIRFVLYSKDANFGYKDGWNDFFEPFCEQTTCSIHRIFNVRSFKTQNQYGFIHRIFNVGMFKTLNQHRFFKWRFKGLFLEITARLLKIFAPFSYFTQDLWSKFLSKKMLEQTYDIPELGINGDFVHACNQLVELTWNYNVSTKAAIEKIIKECILPDNYLSCHIRAGDKITEYKLVSPTDYINILKQYSNKNVFALTDDYRIIQQMQNECEQWQWYTLCGKTERGYVNEQFTKSSSEDKRNGLLNLFASIEIMNKSELFIGTKTSNPSMFMSIYNQDITKGVDSDNNLFVDFLNNCK